MGTETSRKSRAREQLELIAKILAIPIAVLTLILLWRTYTSGPSATEKYRATIEKEVCLGDLEAASQISNSSAYAEQAPGGRIDRDAWLSAMATVRTHLVDGRARLGELTPPGDLQDDWQRTLGAWDGLIGFWDEFRSHTAGLRPAQLTVFTYPGPTWTARQASANTALGVPLSRLLGKSCDAAAGGISPNVPTSG